ncbi:MAG: CHRD domain-containing protein [Cytophagaceae bacterium]
MSLLILVSVDLKAQQFTAILSGTNEMPPALTNASGSVEASLDDDQLIVTGSFTNLSSEFNEEVAGGAHLHLALAGTNGPIEITLVPTLEGDKRSGTFLAQDNTFTLTTEQLEALNNRKLYVNIHTVKYPAGELRGQMTPRADHFFNAILLGSQEVKPVVTAALGGVLAEVRDNQLIVTGSFNDLESDFAEDVAGGSHIHIGFAGENGPIDITLVPTLSEDNRSGEFRMENNTFDLTQEQIEFLRRRNYYVNIHSANFPAGELRGQLTPIVNALFNVIISGASEVPSVKSDAYGANIVELYNDHIILSGSFMDLESPFDEEIGAHIHTGMAGENGPVTFPLSTMLQEGNFAGKYVANDNHYDLSQEQIDTLMARGFYVNIHSQDHPAGEIRGQILPLANAYFTSSLAGIHEVDPVQTEAMGGVKVEWTKNHIVLTGAFSGLMSPLAVDVAGGVHIHQEGPDANGPIVFELATTATRDTAGKFMAEGNMFELTEAQRRALRDEMFYVNVHSQEFQAGEIRGQLLKDPNYFPDTSRIVSPDNNALVNVTDNESEMFEVGFSAANDPDNNTVVYIFQLSKDEDFQDLLINTNTGTENGFSTTMDVLYNILENEGVANDATVTYYHRAIASDGSEFTQGPSRRIQLKKTREETTSLFSKISSGQMNVFPNPFIDITQVEFNSSYAGTGTVSVLNASGLTVYTKSLSISNGQNNTSIDLSHLKEGIYFINIINDGYLINTQKVIKN